MEYCDRWYCWSFPRSNGMGSRDWFDWNSCHIHWIACIPLDSAALLGSFDEIQGRLHKDRISNASGGQDRETGDKLDCFVIDTTFCIVTIARSNSCFRLVWLYLLCNSCGSCDSFHSCRH